MSTVLRIEEIPEDSPPRDPDARFVRGKRTWRTPKLHLTRSSGTHTITSPDGCSEFNKGQAWFGEPGEQFPTHDTYCNMGFDGRFADLFDELPEGFEICQPCAEAMEFGLRREREQSKPDRKSYNDRTIELLARAEEERGRI